MKAYLAFKFKEDYSNKQFIGDVSGALAHAGIETTVMVRDYEKWGAIKLTPAEFMPLAFKAIDDSDILIAEFTEKGVGLGIEVGYAHAKKKPIIVIAKENTEISDTLRGIADRIIFYSEPEELAQIKIVFD